MLTILAGASALAFASVANADVIRPGAPPPAVFVVTGNPFTGTTPVTATIGNTVTQGSVASPFSFVDEFRFTIGPTGGGLIGTGSGSVITSTAFQFTPTDLDFTRILVNGTELTITRNALGLVESAGASGVSIFSGRENNITVEGLSRGLGSYGGNLTFIPNAVPEPGTWAMMLLGFGAMGVSMRRRRKPAGLMQVA
jgi:hypothetical protein